MNIEEIPVPPEARQGTIDGGYEVQLDAATNTILSEMKQKFGQINEKILFLSPETEAANVFEFYAPKLSERGFTKDDESIPPQGKNYHLSIWRNKGQTVGVAVIDDGRDADGQAIKFLAIYLGSQTIL